MSSEGSKQLKKTRRRNDSTATFNSEGPSPDSLEPAIDGPPSPERIRAYTEQMKRSSIFGNGSRTNTISSSTSSSRSRGSTSASMEHPNLSRQSSVGSRGSTMPPPRERPESIQIFGKQLFPRRKRRNTHEHHNSGRSVSSLAVGEEIREEGPDDYRGDTSRQSTMNSSYQSPNPDEPHARHFISTPFNFQHITHTRHNHLPNLQRTGHNELLSEFVAIRASQAPLYGDLKEIRAQDLHFDNFSSEALTVPQQPVKYSQSHDNLRSPPQSGPPPRPPRSPLSPTCPVALPTRTSSWTASVLLDSYDPTAAATLTTDRPHTGTYRKTTPRIASPVPTPPLPPSTTSWSEPQDSYFSDRPISHAVTTPGDEAWPLPLSPPIGYGTELADVQEEDEEAGAKRRSRASTRNSILRASQSVPALRRNSQDRESAVIPATVTIFDKPPLSPGFKSSQESWDNAIDYAYEHEAEADCDYQWERTSFDDGATIDAGPSSYKKQSAMDFHLNEDDNSIYHGRFRPSLLVPSPYDVPELSPLSNTSTASSDPRTPSTVIRPSRLRPVSHASSFKESHGFNLSPSLLIPHDFQSQVDQDALYEQAFKDHQTNPPMFVQMPYSSFSPIDESTASSAASFQSSDFSRGSARSSSSTRISAVNSRGSQDSSSLGHSASGGHMHRSISSASSLPDLIPSTLRDVKQPRDAEVPDISALNLKANGASVEATTPVTETNDGTLPIPAIQHGRSKGVMHDHFNGVNHVSENPLGLSPVAESFDNVIKDDANGNSHGRKVSAPVMTTTVKDYTLRARAATSTAAGNASRAGTKRRGSYMLFPQV
ncbi:hypothetical protein OIDMADRAFT_176050 [Oidiodendron maius Zn]|uniref:CRIB domain-containing protein n=1 Tax=Oidiodendron maius (strain Zn) TaxID=913774 RepID=A0A0C3HSB6_OIDMZ|nr:hypothetical protein OIDMADRAFT_176050 [Oidiodendron maius Zn]